LADAATVAAAAAAAAAGPVAVSASEEWPQSACL